MGHKSDTLRLSARHGRGLRAGGRGRNCTNCVWSMYFLLPTPKFTWPVPGDPRTLAMGMT